MIFGETSINLYKLVLPNYYLTRPATDQTIWTLSVLKDIFQKGKEPYSDYRPKEMIHSLLSIGSINARMVTSELITAGINKGLIELSRKVKDMAGIKWKDNLIE